jgi:hypothetical protein
VSRSGPLAQIVLVVALQLELSPDQHVAGGQGVPLVTRAPSPSARRHRGEAEQEQHHADDGDDDLHGTDGTPAGPRAPCPFGQMPR